MVKGMVQLLGKSKEEKQKEFAEFEDLNLLLKHGKDLGTGQKKTEKKEVGEMFSDKVHRRTSNTAFQSKPSPTLPAFNMGTSPGPGCSTPGPAPSQWPGKAAQDGPSAWVLVSIWTTQGRLLASNWPISSHCSYLENAPADRRSVCFLSLL